MMRAAAVLCVLELWGCSDGTYVIGRLLDGGSASDAGAEARVDAAVDGCDGVHAGALVCAGFEPESLTAEWDDTVLVNGGTLERTTDRAYSGSASLRAVTAAAESAAVVVHGFAPVSSGELHLRAFVYVPGAVPTEIINLFFLGADPYPDPGPFVGMDFNLQDGAVEVFSPQADPTRQTADSMIPRDRWFCFRARVEIADDAAIDLLVDDALALHATGVDTAPPEGVTQLRAGIDWSSDQTDLFEVYIDDVVLDTTPVGCAP